MHKGILLRADIWIQGEDEPAHNYAEAAMQLVKDLLAASHANHPDWKVMLTELTENKDAAFRGPHGESEEGEM
jgi:hypothetical protein